jgi:predicted phosphodiesterase
MKIKLVSDLHLEFSDIHIPNDQNYDVLILSGDIMIAEDLRRQSEESIITAIRIDSLTTAQNKAKRFRDFLQRVSNDFPDVVYVAGNHEFYHGRWVESLANLKAECSKYPNIHVLENEIWDRDEFTFIGTTLWTDMNKNDPVTLYLITRMMNDYRAITYDVDTFRKLAPVDTVRRHRESISFIKNTIADRPDRKYVVVGHHAPTLQSTHPKFADDTIGNGAYRSDLSEFILDHPQIKLWTHGHTHDAFDYMCGETRIVCNPRGYEGYEPDSGWNRKIVIDL